MVHKPTLHLNAGEVPSSIVTRWLRRDSVKVPKAENASEEPLATPVAIRHKNHLPEVIEVVGINVDPQRFVYVCFDHVIEIILCCENASGPANYPVSVRHQPSTLRWTSFQHF